MWDVTCVAGDLLEILYVGSVMGAWNRLIICSSNVVSVEEFGVIWWMLAVFLTLVCTGMIFWSRATIWRVRVCEIYSVNFVWQQLYTICGSWGMTFVMVILLWLKNLLLLGLKKMLELWSCLVGSWRISRVAYQYSGVYKNVILVLVLVVLWVLVVQYFVWLLVWCVESLLSCL
jgi:hypothetical protein